MDSAWISLLACPVSGSPYDADAVRTEGADLLEAFLVSQDERRVRPILAGVAVLPADLGELLSLQGNVVRRTPIHDPRLARFIYGDAGNGHDQVDFSDVVAHYRDLVREVPPGYDTTPHPLDQALQVLLDRVRAQQAPATRALLVGCGVGRSTFVLNAFSERTLGIDSSLARVRRARNIAVTREHFFLPGPRELGIKELALDLSPLVRQGADFAVADALQLPVVDAAFDIVVLSEGDAGGAWEDPAPVLARARRALRPDGLLVAHVTLGAMGVQEQEGPWCACVLP